MHCMRRACTSGGSVAVSATFALTCWPFIRCCSLRRSRLESACFEDRRDPHRQPEDRGRLAQRRGLGPTLLTTAADFGIMDLTGASRRVQNTTMPVVKVVTGVLGGLHNPPYSSAPMQ